MIKQLLITPMTAHNSSIKLPNFVMNGHINWFKGNYHHSLLINAECEALYMTVKSQIWWCNPRFDCISYLDNVALD